MSAVVRPAVMTREEFLLWDVTQEARFEYDGVAPVAMVGGTADHAAITRNLLGLLWQALRGRACQPYGGDLRIEVAGRVRYPDAMVSCTAPQRGDLVCRDPVVIFEVLSPGTALTDTTTKNAEYAATPSIRRYVMLHQERIGAIVFARMGTAWTGSLLGGAAARLDMPEIGVSLSLGELYEGVIGNEPSLSIFG